MARNEILWAASCLHIGARACRLNALEDHIRQAQKGRWRIALMGDLIDNGVSAGSRHLGLEFESCMSPMEQIELAYHLLEPVHSQVIGIWGGNHSYRTMRIAGNHPERILSLLLGKVAPRADISRMAQILALYERIRQEGEMGSAEARELEKTMRERFEEIPREGDLRGRIPFFPGLGTVKLGGIRIVGHHGVHARSRDNWLRLERAARGYDLYLTGHNHTLSTELGQEDVAGERRTAWFVSCGTYQGYEEYAAIALYPPKPIGSALVIIERGKILRVEYLT